MRNKQRDNECRYIKTLEEKIKTLEKIIFGKDKKEARELKFIYKYVFKK